MATKNQRDINLVAISRTRVITMRRSNNFTCLFLSVTLLPFCSSRDNVATGGAIMYSRDTLVSAGERFELGFFSPKGNFDSFVGIWYYRSDPQIVIWVANRDNPINRNTASFSLVDGNLKVLNEEQPIWSTNLSSSSTRLAKLLDSGNLVLIEGERIVWQSFNYPTDTFLPGMLMTDDFKLTSWASKDDPKPGRFTFQRDQKSGTREYQVIGDGSPFWKSVVYREFIQADGRYNAISFLLSNRTTSASLPAGTSPRLVYENITLPDYNNTRLVMRHNGQIQYFRLGNSTMPVLSEPTGLCSVFNACGKFGSCNVENVRETMCKCLPGFKPAESESQTSGSYFRGCHRKSSKCCGKNSNNSADHFLNLTMMKAGRPDMHILAVNETQCRQKCLNASSCQAYSLVEEQSRAQNSTSTCYIWLDELNNIQESAKDGHDLYVRVPLSDIESTSRSCGTCGTLLVPYPLSMGQSCGDQLYSGFRCDNADAQLYFEQGKVRYRVTSITPENRIFTIQFEEAFDCKSSSLTEINQQLNQSSPFIVSGECFGGQNIFSTIDSSGSVGKSEVTIEWSNPTEPLCNSSKDCDWPNATCRNASDGITKCLCDSGFSWNSFSVNCSLGENVGLAN